MPILKSIFTGDETMVVYHDPLSKKESMEWQRLYESRPKKANIIQLSLLHKLRNNKCEKSLEKLK